MKRNPKQKSGSNSEKGNSGNVANALAENKTSGIKLQEFEQEDYYDEF